MNVVIDEAGYVGDILDVAQLAEGDGTWKKCG